MKRTQTCLRLAVSSALSSKMEVLFGTLYGLCCAFHLLISVSRNTEKKKNAYAFSCFIILFSLPRFVTSYLLFGIWQQPSTSETKALSAPLAKKHIIYNSTAGVLNLLSVKTWRPSRNLQQCVKDISVSVVWSYTSSPLDSAVLVLKRHFNHKIEQSFQRMF